MTDTKEILLFRHGDVDDRYKKRFRGALDVALSPLGEQMSRANAEFLLKKPIDLVITSGLQRTDFLGKLVANQGIPHLVDPRFREAHFGEWEGKNWEEVRALYPEEARCYKEDFIHMKFPGGEAVSDLEARLLAGWKEVLALGEKRIAIIGHSTGNGCLMAYLKNRPFEGAGLQVLGSFHEILLEGSDATILRENIVVF